MTCSLRTSLLLLGCLAPLCLLAQAPASGAHYEISGIVVSAKSGEPLGNASVSAMQSSDRKVMAQTVTDATGRFRISDVPAGKYDLIASHKGYATAAYQQHDGGVNTAIVTGDGLTSTGLLFQLEPLGRIYGTVQEDSGDPVPDAQLKVFQKDIYRGTGKMIPVMGSNADALGNFEVSGLSPGSYVLCVVARPWYALPKRSFGGMEPPPGEGGLARLDVVYAPTCYADASNPSEAESITIAAGEQMPLNFTLHPTPPVHMTLPIAKDDNGQPVMSSLQVSTDVFGTQQFIPAAISFTRADPNGPYTADIELPPGQYELSLSGQGGEQARHMNLNADAGSSTLSMAASDPDPSLSGTLQTENGGAFSGNSFVFLESKGGENRSAQVNPDGTFTMQAVPPGVYTVGAGSSGGFVLGIAHLNAKGAQVQGHSLSVGSEAVQLSIIVRQARATLSGIVKSDGKPRAGVFVLLVPTGAQQNGDPSVPNQSDSDGTFNFPRVSAGDYTVVAIEQGWKLDWGKADAIQPYLAHGEQVRIDPQTRQINLKNPLDPQPLNLK